jgi:alpha-tubulin suppressor-like RCC1 family protein
VAEDGAVYTCGRGDDGRLGLGDGQPRQRLTRVPQALFAGSRVVMVSCGGGHTMAVTAVGHAWTCGGNLYGQLGVGDTANRLGFTRVDAGQLGGARIVMAVVIAAVWASTTSNTGWCRRCWRQRCLRAARS